MSDYQKKTPREIAEDVWKEMCQHHGAPSAYISDIEQAIQAERDAYNEIKNSYEKYLSMDLDIEGERNELREENQRMREVFKEAEGALRKLDQLKKESAQ
jgi:5'-deoxynucleotidase YfbR-like HD superfamily hydrolase